MKAGRRWHHHSSAPRRRLMGQGEQPAVEKTREHKSRSGWEQYFLGYDFIQGAIFLLASGDFNTRLSDRPNRELRSGD
jgi:hypothetical protein